MKKRENEVVCKGEAEGGDIGKNCEPKGNSNELGKRRRKGKKILSRVTQPVPMMQATRNCSLKKAITLVKSPPKQGREEKR